MIKINNEIELDESEYLSEENEDNTTVRGDT